MPVSALSRRLAWALVGLAFLSKVSFSFTRLVPPSLGFLLLQGGLHPYGNVALNLALGGALLLSLRRHGEWPELRRYHRLYVAFALGTVAILWVQHVLQLLLGVETNALLVLVTLLTCSFLILVFGLVLPQLLEAREFLRGVARICLVVCAASLLLLLAGAPAMYKGGRFVGVLKHIPYMVSCSTIGYLFTLPAWAEAPSAWRRLARALPLAVFLECLWLTGTRSALFAVLAGTPIFLLAFRTPSPGFRMARLLGLWLTLVGLALFGSMGAEFAADIATGKKALGQRAPQDGVSDRMEEISRGLEMLAKSPHVGLGLLSKFKSDDAEDVAESYSSFQDPHNLFISSAVVAGWPFGLWVFAGFLALASGAVALVLRREPPGLAFGVYLLSHLPILSIYHMHLSLGGLADRIYWLCFAYLALLLGGEKAPRKAPGFSESLWSVAKP